jgi:CheY-like chemotaxis protein
MTVSSSHQSASIDANSLNQHISESRLREAREAAPHDVPPGGTERIALAEDDPLIRRTIQHLLEELGYQVEAYTSGTEVLEAMSRDDSPIELLLTDHEMPGLTGYELAQQFRAEHPRVHVLLASGCPKESIVPSGAPQDWPPFLQKPYCLTTLARTLRDVLDGPTPG